MTAVIWMNLLLAVPFVAAWVGIPLWMVAKRPDTTPDFSDAYTYLAATQPQPAPRLAGPSQETAGLRLPAATTPAVLAMAT